MTKYREEYVVVIDDKMLTAVDGHLSGDKDLLRLAQQNALLRRPIQIAPPYGEPVEAQLDDPNNRLGIIAAMMSPSPGRAKVVRAPYEVERYFAEISDPED